VSAGIGGARLVVDQRHFAEHFAAVEDRQTLLTHSGDHARDADVAVDDNVQSITALTFGEDQALGIESLFAGVGRQQSKLLRRESLLAEDCELGLLRQADRLPFVRHRFGSQRDSWEAQ